MAEKSTKLVQAKQLSREEQMRFHMGTMMLFYEGALKKNVDDDYRRWSMEQHDVVERILEFLDEINALHGDLAGFGFDVLCAMLAPSIGLRVDSLSQANLMRLILLKDSRGVSEQASTQIKTILAVERMSYVERDYLRSLVIYGDSPRSKKSQHAYFVAMMKKGDLRRSNNLDDEAASWERMKEIEKISKAVLSSGRVRSNLLDVKGSFYPVNNTGISESDFLGSQIARILSHARNHSTERKHNENALSNRVQTASHAEKEKTPAGETATDGCGEDIYVDPGAIAAEVSRKHR